MDEIEGVAYSKDYDMKYYDKYYKTNLRKKTQILPAIWANMIDPKYSLSNRMKKDEKQQ